MYYLKIASGIMALALVASLSGASHHWAQEVHEPFHYTFSKDSSIDVDNVEGDIQLTGDSGNTIRVEGERILRADDKDQLNRAKKEVTLDVNEKDGVAQLYVNGPFRGNHSSDDDHGFHIHYDDRHYEVAYNFVIKVPRNMGLRLRTVNGRIDTDSTRGKFDVHGVNGPVSMKAVAGSGSLRTVNGAATIGFAEAPKTASDFETVNGTIEATFPPNLSADINVKTLNGGAFTDFDSKAIFPSTAEAENRSNGRRVYRANHNTSLRIGSGGPELSFKTVNGDIRIKKGA